MERPRIERLVRKGEEDRKNGRQEQGKWNNGRGRMG